MTTFPTKKFPIPLLVLFTIVGLLLCCYPSSFSAVKSIHLVALISWFAGLFYLPRLFVYHSESASKDVAHTLSIMEWKLFYYIMNPAALITLVSGLWMIGIWGWVFPVWLHIKLALVLLLLVFHCYCWRLVHVFQADKNQRAGKFYRILNEVPTLLLIAIVYLVVAKPFG
jgi:protoporphyrinogen IX oxidase